MNSSESLLEELICSLSSNKHFVQGPIVLPGK